MATEIINIQIREDGSRVVSRNIDQIGKEAEETSSSLDRLKGLLLTIASAATVVALARMADQYTNIQNRLRLVTDGTANLARVTKELQNVANDTRTDFVATSELYARLASSTKDLGLGQQDMLQFTKSLNQAIVLSGASAEEAAGGIRQLSQGLASGTLRGDELNSVLENFPRAADVIAQSLGVTRGELRKMGADGKITAETIVNAFLNAGEQLDAEFGTTIPTLSQAFTVLKNNVLIFVGEFNEKFKITERLSEFVIYLSKNLDTVLPLLTAVGVAIAAAFVPGLIASFAAQIKILWALLMANPFIALAAVVTGAITAIVLFRDEIKLGIDDTTTLGDLMRAVWEDIVPVIQTVADAAAKFFGWLTNTSAGTFGELLNHTVGYEHESESTWLKLVRVVAKVFDMIGGVIRGFFAGAWASLKKFGSLWMSTFENMGDAAKAALTGDVEGVKAALNAQANIASNAGSEIGTAFSDAFREEVLRQNDSGIEALLDSYIDRAAEISKERLAGLDVESPLLGGTPGGDKPIVDPNAAKELDKLKDALRNVMDQADPVGAAMRQLAEAEDILTRAVTANLITQEQKAQIFSTLTELMKDQLDPLGALNDEIDKNIELLKMGNEQRDIESQMYQLTEDLKRRGVKLTAEETAALRAKLIVEQELMRISQMRDQLEAQGQGRRQRDFQDQVTAMQQLMGDSGSGFTGTDAFNQSNALLGGLFDNTQQYIQAQLEAQRELYANVEMLRQADLISEETAAQARMQIWANTQSIQLQTASNFFGQLAVLSRSENKKLAAIGKAAAIAQTIIKTYESATSAYASLAGIPYIGPALGAAAAAAAVAAGMANVAAIRSQSTGFRTGGHLTVGGSGGTDSQLVSLRATPGEKIHVNTPAQSRAMEQGGSPDVNVPVSLVVVDNEERALNAMRGPKGKQLFLDLAAMNASELGAMLRNS